MPKTLNPNNNFPTSITNFPISGNNEPIAIEPLEAAIQAVLDRTENLHQSRLTVEGVGVKRIRQFASRSALSAASGFADGDIVSVDGYGLYRLFVSSSATVDGLWVLSATGGGRWIHLESDLRGANLGLATLDGSGRLAQDVRDNSIASAHIVNGSVTSAKLASGAVVGHLGYTPVNKAGDTMTGTLVVGANVGEILSIKGGTSNHGYLGIYAQSSNQSARSAYLGFGTAGTNDLTIANEKGGNIIMPNGVLQARYDHQDRFSVSMNAGVGYSFSIGAGLDQVLGRFLLTVPSGKNLYVRRVRFHLNLSELQLRVVCGSAVYSSSGAGDISANTLLAYGGGDQLIEVWVRNTSSGSITLNNNPVFCWVELEIR